MNIGKPTPPPSPLAAVPRVRLEGVRKQAMETGRNRLLVTAAVLTLAFLVIGGRLVELTSPGNATEPRVVRAEPSTTPSAGRADIVDRHGVVLATTLPTVSLYADPGDVLDAAAAADLLVTVLDDLDRERTLAKLKSAGSFVWLRRNLTPRQQFAVNRLGIPGLFFQRSERRVYPHGRAAAHVLGLTDVDGRGISGIERHFDQLLRRAADPLRLSIDLRVQYMLRRELSAVIAEFDALGAAGLVLDAASGEVVAMVSLPDFDPNLPATAGGEAGFNRATKGVYEMGSTFKLFTIAMALDSGTVTLGDGYDASRPIRVARFTITDYHGKNRWLSVPEILVYSSNIGAARMAIDVGTRTQQDYLGRLGLLRRAAIELPEVGVPLTPPRWRDINTMTIAYGHGIAVSPLQVAVAVATLVNGGVYRPPTLLAGTAEAPPAGRRVLSEETSRQMRRLMRLVVRNGTGRKADARGFRVGGKTGTAEKLIAGGYRRDALISSFVGAFPIEAPRYVVMVMIDEPKGNQSTLNYATGGWVAAPMVRRMVRRMASLDGIRPRQDDDGAASGQPLLASLGAAPESTREQRIETR